MFKQGDLVRSRQDEASVFLVQETAEDGRVLVLPTSAALGAYPFPMPAESLVLAEG
ncbi:hypothetical protein [Nocardia tengchongensis]|uniref:hypothetical protein n=1 Tax=Nocardia tengchongensis TaxID=2055889 RepID=UPI003653A8A9